MKTASPKYSLNSVDYHNLLKNAFIFFLPSLIWGLLMIQASEFSRQTFLLGAWPSSIISMLIKALEYYLAESKK